MAVSGEMPDGDKAAELIALIMGPGMRVRSLDLHLAPGKLVTATVEIMPPNGTIEKVTKALQEGVGGVSHPQPS